MDITIREIDSFQEIKRLIEISSNNYTDPYFTLDKGYAAKCVFHEVLSGNLLCTIESGDELLGYGLACIMSPHLYSREQCLSQKVFHVTSKGKRAINAIIAFHEEMIKFAKRKGIYLLTSNSILEDYQNFYKVLEHAGWEHYGSAMVYRIPRPVGRPLPGQTYGS
jgi:hypothetical protein